MDPFFQSESLKDLYLNFIKDWEANKSITVNSSGSTGEAKEIFLTKDQLMLSASKTIHFFNLSSGIKALLCLSMNTIAGKMMIARSIVGNWDLTICEPTSNPLHDLNDDFDFAAFVPLQLQKIIDEDVEKLKRIKIIIVGGAPISNTLENQLKTHGITVFQTFGMTETVSHIALKKMGLQSEKNYKTLTGITVSEKNDKLIIDYPEMQKEAFVTNDLVRIIGPNEFEWIGRADFMINSGGIKLNPELVEDKLNHFIKSPFFITGIFDEKLGMKLALVIESIENIHISKKELQEFLEKYEIPKVYAILNSFVKTESGKTNRFQTLNLIQPIDWKSIY